MASSGYMPISTTEDDYRKELQLTTQCSIDGFKTPSTRSPSPRNHVCQWQRNERRQARLNTKLLYCVENGCFKGVKKALDSGANVNSLIRKTRMTALQIAALMGFSDILAELVTRGADIQACDMRGQNVVHYIAYYGHAACMNLVLSRNGSEGIMNKRIETVPEEQLPILSRFVLHNWDYDCSNIESLIPTFESGSTPLHVACQHCNLSIVESLLKMKADHSIENDLGNLPLNVVGEAFLSNNENSADFTCFISVVKLLLSSGATFKESLNIPYRITPLHTAIEMGCCEAIKLLIETSADPGSYNLDGQTTIHSAILKQQEEVLKLLIDARTQNQEQDVNMRNRCGFTPLQLAVETQWALGISLLLEAGCDITETSHGGDTALHLAAATGNISLLEEILDILRSKEVINLQNINNETPLLCAIKSGNLSCVQLLLKADADVSIELPNNMTVLHRTAEYGHSDILSELLTTTFPDKNWINKIDSSHSSGMAALHLAAYMGKTECVRVLLENGCDIRVRTNPDPHDSSTALHLASGSGHADVVSLLLHYDQRLVYEGNGLEWTALHVAAFNGHRNCIKELLDKGADLSINVYNAVRSIDQTGVDMIMQNVSRPTEFLEEIFNACIEVNDYAISDPHCVINVKYEILTPKSSKPEEMKVMKALMNTGNRFGQKRLLLHPVIESFLYLKWKCLCPFFYTILVLYSLFVLSLTIVATSAYYFEVAKPTDTFLVINREIWTWVLGISLLVIVLQEILHAIEHFKKYIRELETWVKWGSFFLSFLVVVVDHTKHYWHDWPRHITTVAVLLTWMELMFLLSRFPDWGYYVLMFFKVTGNVVKVLLTFGFLVIGFSFSFLIEFRADSPFSNPWEAIVKTMVMMTAEFDYADLFSKDNKEDITNSFVVGRIVFIVFLVLASIVLMNLMVGLAVSDINDLEIQGKIQRLVKQVDFLSALDRVVKNKIIEKFCPKDILQKPTKKIDLAEGLIIYPGRPLRTTFKRIPLILKEEIVEKAMQQIKKDEEISMQMIKDMIETIGENIINKITTNKKVIEATPQLRMAKHLETVSILNEVKAKLEEMENRFFKAQPMFLKNSIKLESIDDRIGKIESNLNNLLQLCKKDKHDL